MQYNQALEKRDCENSSCTSDEEATRHLAEVLADEYGAAVEPSSEDELHSPIVMPNVERIRAVITYLQSR